MDNKDSESCSDLLIQGLNDSKSIAHKYYSQRPTWINNLLLRKETTDFYEIDGRVIQNISIKMNNNKNDNLIKSDLEFEEFITVNDISLLKSKFAEQVSKKLKILLSKEDFYFNRKAQKYANCLDRNEFNETLKVLPFYKAFLTELEDLFDRIDFDNTGYISWSDVANYFLIRFRENEYTDNIKVLPFNNKPKIKLCEHNRMEVTIKFLKVENPLRYINISRKGAIGIWSKNLNFIRKFQINENTNQLSQQYMVKKTKNTMWITDAVLLPETNRICLSTSRRELRFFIFSSENLNEEFSICNLESSPVCLDFYFEKETEKGILLFGDISGVVNMITFLKPKDSLFDKLYRPLKSILEIQWHHLKIHHKFIQQHSIKIIEDNPIIDVKYISMNKTIIASSKSLNKPLIIFDPDFKKKEYIFELNNGCECFDFNMSMHILVTAGYKSEILVWDIYSPFKPISKLYSNGQLVISLKIHYQVGYLYSLSNNSLLEVWDLKDDQKVQSLELNFPNIFGTKPEFGPFPISFFTDDSESILLVTCKDYVAQLMIGDNLKVSSSIPLTANSPITSMAYSAFFKIIITCSEDSNIIFWNLTNGKRIYSIPNAHNKEEINICTLDSKQRTLYTGDVNGIIKSWNIANGELLQTLESVDEAEINGLTIIDKKRIIISVGANKKLITYTDVDFEGIIPTKPKFLYGTKNQHNDEILCSDFYMGLLVTGARDGEINIWSVDSSKIFYSLRNKKETNETLKSVEQVYFLKSDFNYTGLNSLVIISSESGYILFWSLNSFKCYGKFYASGFKEQSIFSITSNFDDNILIVGDTKGFIYLWDIKDSKPNKKEKNFVKPKCIKTWRCHDSTIVSCAYIPSSTSHQELLVTASTDWCCRVWTLNGDYIGSFGQEKKWALYDPETFQSRVSEENDIYLENLNKINESVKIIEESNDESKRYSLSKFTDKYNYLDKLKLLKKFNKKTLTNYKPKLILNTVEFEEIKNKKDNLENKRIHSNGTPYCRLPIHEFEPAESFDEINKLAAMKLPQIYF